VPRSISVVAKIDRVEQRRDGSLVIADYKTGYAPRYNSVAAVRAAADARGGDARAGAFAGHRTGRGTTLALEYWKLTGNSIAGEIKAIASEEDALRLAIEAEKGLRRLVASFRKQKTPYRSRPHPLYAPGFGTYDHLARVAEWSSGGGDDS
jgi:ATP-dependent helicase/nuclease subunit B